MFILRLLFFSIFQVNCNKYAPEDGADNGTDNPDSEDDSGSGDSHPNDSVDPALIADQMEDLEGINQLMFDFFEQHFGPDGDAYSKECQADIYRYVQSSTVNRGPKQVVHIFLTRLVIIRF